MATNSGVRSTTPGELFPEDVRMESTVSEVLGTLSRWDPAYELNDGLLRSARSGTEWQRREKDAMDAEDEEYGQMSTMPSRASSNLRGFGSND
jgi:hypothetical protein